MKKLFALLTLVVLGITTFTACSKDDENTGIIGEEGEFVGDGSITMVTEGNIYLGNLELKTFNEGDTVTIDWGDGKVEVLKSVKAEYTDEIIYKISATHNYSTEKQHTIKIMSDMKIKKFYTYGSIISLDVSQCTSLEELRSNYGDLTSLDVSKCVNLEHLSFVYSKLTSLDVSKNVKLEYLYCYENQLTSLDVSKNVMLVLLDCGHNQFTSLDISKNVNLVELRCSHNSLTSLDVSKCVNLEVLWFSSNKITILDVSKNLNLKKLDCHDNQFTASAMNQIYNALPDWNDIVYGGQIRISQPYGDYSIAEGKGWYISKNDIY